MAMANGGAERTLSMARVQKRIATNCLQGNGRTTFLQKKPKAMPGKKLDFWDSDWRRVGLGLGDSIRVLSGIVQ